MVLGSGDTDALLELLEEITFRLDRSSSSFGVVASEPDDGSGICFLKASGRDRNLESDFPVDGRKIDFRREGVPTFVEGISGFSTIESFGRWTNADIARIIFTTPLPTAFDLEIVMTAFEPNLNQPILVVAGADAKILYATTSDIRLYKIKFSCKFLGRMIEFFIPHALSPVRLFENSTDSRRLGIGIQSVVVRTDTATPSLDSTLQKKRLSPVRSLVQSVSASFRQKTK